MYRDNSLDTFLILWQKRPADHALPHGVKTVWFRTASFLSAETDADTGKGVANVPIRLHQEPTDQSPVSGPPISPRKPLSAPCGSTDRIVRSTAWNSTSPFYEPKRKIIGSRRLRGDEKGPIVVKLGAMGAIKGRLLDGDDKPLVGVEVSVMYRERDAGQIQGLIHEAK